MEPTKDNCIITEQRNFPGWRHPGVALLIVTCALSFIRFYRLRYFGLFSDESENIVVGWLVGEDRRLYDTIFTHHMPLAYMASHLVGLFFSTDYFPAYRAIPYIFLIVASLSFVFSPLQTAPHMRYLAASIFLALTTLLAPLWSGQMLLVDTLWGALLVIFCNIFLLPALRAELRVPACTQRSLHRIFFSAGFLWVFWTCATFETIPAILIFVMMLPLLCLVNCWRIREMCWWVSAGALLALFFHALWLMCFGSIAGFWNYAVKFNFIAYGPFFYPSETTAGSQISQHLLRIAQGVWSALFDVSSPLMLLALPVFLVGLVLEGANLLGQRRWISTVLLILLFFFVNALKGRGGFHAAPYFLVLFAFSSWACLRPISHARSISVNRSVAVLILVLVLSIITWACCIAQQHISFAFNEPNMERELAPWLPTIRYIKQHSTEQDTIAVFVLFPQLYFETKRKPAHSGVFYLPWNAKYEEITNDHRTCRELAEHPPKFVWLDRAHVFSVIPWSSFGACIESFVAENYRATPHQHLYRRKKIKQS